MDQPRTGQVPRPRTAGEDAQWRAQLGIDGNQSIGTGAHPNSSVRKEGGKVRDVDKFLKLQFEDVHAGSSDVKERLAVIDGADIYAQVVYPTILGFGGQASAKVDPELRLACPQIYNDAMAELQEESGQRLFPMALLPWWNVAEAVKETERCAALGLKGININSDPHMTRDDNGAMTPDLGTQHWFPLWEVCNDRNIPINFHIGGSGTSIDWMGSRGGCPYRAIYARASRARCCSSTMARSSRT